MGQVSLENPSLLWPVLLHPELKLSPGRWDGSVSMAHALALRIVDVCERELQESFQVGSFVKMWAWSQLPAILSPETSLAELEAQLEMTCLEIATSGSDFRHARAVVVLGRSQLSEEVALNLDVFAALLSQFVKDAVKRKITASVSFQTSLLIAMA
eukprot:5898238-Amphidinium_carterae.1